MANERTYYVMCENRCLFPALTKEQTLTAIAQAVETGEIQDVDAGFVTTIKETNKGDGLKFWVGTTAEYNALTELDPKCFYIKTDDTTLADLHAVAGNNSIAINELQNEFAEHKSTSEKDIKGLKYTVDALDEFADSLIRIVQQKTKTVDGVTWFYEWWNNGVAKMWCKATATYSTGELLEAHLTLPCTLIEDGIGFVTCNEWWQSSGVDNYPKVPRILCKTDVCSVQVHNHLGNFTTGQNAVVAIEIIGKWK